LSRLKKQLLATLFCLCLAITGCKGSMELNELHIVHSVAIDQGEDGGVKVTAEIAKLSTGGQQPKGMQESTFYLTSEGSSLFEAARLMRAKSDRTLLWGHTTAIIFSTDLARGGIGKQIDDIRRLRQFRNSTLIYAMEGRAYEALKVSMPNLSISSQALRGLSEGGESTALTEQTSLIDVYQELINGYKDISLPSVEVVKDQVDNKLKLLQTKGLYAFKGDHLIALMHASETKGYLRAAAKMNGSIEAVACDAKHKITFENISNRSEIEVDLNKQQIPEVNIEIYADLDLVSVQCDNVKVDPRTIAGWEKEINHSITEDLERYIRFSQKHKVDLLGIGEMIHRKHPKQWRKMKEKWGTIYADAKFTLKVHGRVDHTNFTF
jgi:spore germination protein KC